MGAVMFLFEGDFGRILHTGDFRWELASQPQLLSQPALAGPPLDRLYLDNTYCAPCYAFPPRLDACKEVIAAVLAHPEHHVVLGVDSLGKEELLAAVAAATGLPVCIPPERFAAVRLLGLPQRLFTTDPAATRLSALARHRVSVRAVAELNRLRPTLVVLPSAFASASNRRTPAAPAQPTAAVSSEPSNGVENTSLTEVELDNARLLLVQVPYSLHSSFAELQAVVTALAPRAILPVVASREQQLPSGEEQLAGAQNSCGTHQEATLLGSPAAAIEASLPLSLLFSPV
ncbi:hypothetical protein WJX81_003508 [Elliptochloris bilobata]|uniref:Protein artemis n=1 Tax=Elliptochloris bilobata TaxID=381761 RepID=A0AAW1QI71_9CHLO